MLNIGVEIKIEQIKKGTTRMEQRVELLYLLDGRLGVAFQQGTVYMQKEDVLVINSRDPVSLTVLKEGVLCHVLIERAVFNDLLGTDVYSFDCDSTQDEDKGRFSKLRRLLNELLRDYLQNGSHVSFSQIVTYFRVLEELSANFLSKAEEQDGESESYGSHRLQMVVNYVQENYNKHISLQDLAEKLYVTDSHLSRVLKRELGVGFREYVNSVRLQHAVDDLLYTDKSIIRVSNDNGFSGVAMFNKVFRETYGMTPTAYKKKFKPQDEMSEESRQELKQEVLSNIEEYLDSHPETDTPKVKTSVDVAVSVAKSRIYTRPWINMINVGTALDLLNSKTQRHLLRLKSELDFAYVRFWGLFLDGMMILPQDPGMDPNFSRLDEVISFLLSNRMKPFFQLGPKPKIISRSAYKTFSNEQSLRIMNYDEKQWAALVDALMRHLVAHFGGQEVESWIFEMWSPCPWDSPWADWYTEERFAAVCRAVKKYVPNAMFGGCEFTHSAHSALMPEIISTWREKRAVPDYLSYSAFPYMVEEDMRDAPTSSRWLTDPNDLMTIIQDAREDMEKAGCTDLGLFITTWNNTISGRNILNDSVYKGAYIVKNAIDAVNSVDMLGYWVCSDSVMEHYDATSLLFGGAGLISKDGMLKPAFYAFSFLKLLKSRMVERGENYIITCNTHDSYTIVYHNMKNLNYSAYLKPEDEFTYQDLDVLFEDMEPMKFTFRLDGVESGTYNVRFQCVNSQSGSILDEWQKIGGYKEFDREDLTYLNQISIPRRKMFRLRDNKGELTLEHNAQPNEFGVIEIFPCVQQE